MAGISRGPRFEERVCDALRLLENVGLATDIKRQDYVEDRDRNQRKVDISVTLRTNIVHIRVSMECKSRERTITLDEIDQIKMMRLELPERNIFWLIYEGQLGQNAAKALRRAGIATYSIEQFERIIDSICSARKEWHIDSLATKTARFSSMDPNAFALFASVLEDALIKCFEPLSDIVGVLKLHRRYNNVDRPPLEKAVQVLLAD
jgi:hypothetical protein